MKKVYLIILDGFGLAPDSEGNAITQAQAPYLKSLISGKAYPMSRLKTHGEPVGLPEFQTGGSEAGHITIGAGRAVKLLLTKINDAIEDGSFKSNDVLKSLFEKAAKNNRIHFMGMASDGGVHSFLPHLFGLLDLAKEYGIENVYNHCFLDGRDVGTRTAAEYLTALEAKGGKIASIQGRFYAMDRDQNWERTELAYKTLVSEEVVPTKKSWKAVIEDHYASDPTISDYYVEPHLFDTEAQIQPGDIVINWNFRTDRERQISAALCDASFEAFDRPVKIDVQNYGIFGDYYEGAQQPFNFGDETPKNTLGEYVSNLGGTQLRISETEKFNHVTFFYSGQQKAPFPGEDRILVPSPKCPSYAEKPEMSAYEVLEKALESLNKGYNLVVHNFANPDLVGHSGSLEAAIKAIEIMDECCAKLIPKILEAGYDLIVTSDHGNADKMINEDGSPNASHTKAYTPCVVISQKEEWQPMTLPETGDLRDIAPTLCTLLGIDIPAEMTGKSLLG